MIVIIRPYREGMSSHIDIALLGRIGRSIEQDGIAAIPQQLLTDVAHEAVRLGVRPVLAGVLASPSHPPVARERAFGSVASGVARAYTLGVPTHTAPLAA